MFEDFLANATPDQLLPCWGVSFIGIVFFVVILYFTYARRNDKKKQVKLGLRPQPVLAQTFTPSPPAGGLTPPEPSTEPTTELDTKFLSSQALSPQTPNNISGPAAKTDLNLSLLSQLIESGPNQKVETEDLTMDLSKHPREDKIGLAARINSRAAIVTETTKSASSQPATYKPTPTPTTEQVSQPKNQPQVPAKPAEPVELLRLLRNPQYGQLIVEIAGRRYTKLADITDKQIGEYILKLAAHLLAFTNGMIATEAGVKSLLAPKVGVTPLPPAAAQPVSPPPALSPSPELTSNKLSPDAEAAFLASLAQVKPTPPKPEPKRRGLFGQAKPTTPEEPTLPVLNLAEQINAIVQVRLHMSPLVTTTKLEITSDPGGGIRINVNGRFYSSPDDIPDPEIKQLIKESIRQWEKS